MRKLAPAFLIVFSIFALIASAQDSPPSLPAGSFNLQLRVLDSDTSNPLIAHVASLLFTGDSGEIRSVQLISDAGYVSLPLENGNWRLIALIDRQETQGNDYFGMQSFELKRDSNLTLYMMPAASIAGKVLFENKSVSGARISLRCASEFYEMGKFYENVKSDEFGSFAMQSAPAGNCEIFASASGKIGSTQISITRGEYKSIQIILDSQLQDDGTNFNWLILVGALIILIVAINKIIKRWMGKNDGAAGIADRADSKAKDAINAHAVKPKAGKRSGKQSNNGNDDEGKLKVSSKMKAIIQTLNENEKRIVDHLLENNGRSRQNKIYYALLIPKVTLSRTVFSLENKNIIKTRRLGKVKEIELSEWFRN
ncbi:MAG: hypothetical protein AABX01_00075 [Candidatus Micrarchaeota archaeon]